VRTRKVPGFNIQTCSRLLVALWVLLAVGVCPALPQDAYSKPGAAVRHVEAFSLAGGASSAHLDSTIAISADRVTSSVPRGISTLQTGREPLSLLAGFWFKTVDPTAWIPSDQIADAFDGGCTTSARSGQTATLLPDGRWLLVAGLGQSGPVPSAFIAVSGLSQPTQLVAALNVARTWHTSTLLPDGNVLVLGGVDSVGKVVVTPELFDPSAATFNPLTTPGPTPRAYHSATVLTDGTLLIAGGLSSDGVVLSSVELWDPQTGIRTPIPAQLSVPRRNHCAVLLPDGKVLLWGGAAANGERLNNGELYDPDAKTFNTVNAIPIEAQGSSEGPVLAASKPENGAQNVPLLGMIALRFSEPISVTTVSSNTVSLNGPQGRIPIKVVPAERGRLGFVTYSQPLLPGTSYSLLLGGLKDAANRALSTTQIVFSTQSTPGSEAGIPAGTGGASGEQDSSSRNFPPLQASPGVTAIAGQVLQLTGQPLANVTIRLDGSSEQTQTDRTGRFLLVLRGSAIAGHRQIVIDGKAAGRDSKKTYGLFEYGMNVKSGITNVLPFIIWMPALDTAHAVTIPVPTKMETIVTTPLLPGLELRIPAGTIIYDYYGQVVHQITITSIPVNQPPFPLPNVQVPIYFTIQPGGAWLTTINGGAQGAQLYYPNTYHQKLGTVYQFWNYNPDGQGWYIYGLGRVAPGGQQIVPDPGVLIYGFSGAMVGDAGAPANGPAPGNFCCFVRDLVDLDTGLFVYTLADLELADVIPLTLTRTYRPNDPTSRAFGIGTNHPYDIFIVSPDNDAHIYLILPDGGRIVFDPGGPGHVCTSSPTSFFGATITAGTNTWILTKKDGTVLTFPDSPGASTPQQEAIIAWQDRNGNALTFTRDSNSNLTRIASPNGHYIQFTLDSAGRITEATDNIGRGVTYVYDGNGRLSTVTDAKGGVTTYTYDGSSSNMLSIQNPRGIAYLTNQYDSNNRVTQQTRVDGSIFQFAYKLDGKNNVVATAVTDPLNIARQADGDTVLALVAPKADSKQYQLIGRPTDVVFVTDDVLARYREWSRRGVKFVSTPKLRRVKSATATPIMPRQ
jgi:YD repeat-containing protein